jgi:hypothetical protein
MVSIHQQLIAFEQNFQVRDVLLFRHPGAAVHHEVALFPVGPLQSGRHEIPGDHVPVALRLEVRFLPEVQLFLMGSGIIPPNLVWAAATRR